MQESIDDLYARWQRNPDVSQTVALCDALRGTQRMDLVEIVGSHASRQLDIHALTAAARMYTHTGRLDDAQQVLIAAGRLAPRDGDVYRWLGEVLLRRGDAERAEKVLERAMQFGARDAAAGAWLDRARSLLVTQQSSGMMAVAQEVARAAATNGGAPPPPPAAGAPARPRRDSVPDDAETQVRKNDDVKAALASAGRAPVPPPAAGRPAPGPPLPQFGLPTSSGIGEDFLPSFGATAGASTGSPLIDGELFDSTFDAAFGSLGSPDLPLLGSAQTGNVGVPLSSRGKAAPVSAGTAPFMSPSPPVARGPAAGPPPPFNSPAPPAPPALPLPAPPADLPVNPFLVPPKAPRPVGANGQAMPEARDVLEALQISGVFEPDGAVRPQVFAWDKPDKGKRRIGSLISLIGLAVFIVGGASGAYYYVTGKRAKQHVEGEALLAKVDGDLAASDARLLDPSEQNIAKAFDLESRSPHAALTWLHERALVGLLKGGENVAFEDGTVRAKEVGVEEKRIAFAYVASFLFQGDTAGAAAALAKWDGKADDDAWYQLIAGATFERAGDPRSMDRYAAAVKLDPQLVAAQFLLARATAVDGDPHHAGELAKNFRAKYPDRVEGATLVALAWARDPLRGEPPAEAREIVDKVDVLPTPLKAVAPAVRGLLAIEQHKTEEAKAALQKGLAVADTPGLAAWLGSIALATGDEALARKGALTAVSYSAVYPPARMLAARVALLGARLDEALKASEELPPASPDVAIVTAAVAYEKLDGERMRGALEALPEDAKKLPFLVPLVRGQALMAGNAQALGTDKALDMADDDTPWADLVAMDAALDTGDVDLARKVAAKWHGEANTVRALRAVRLAKLARWDGKNEDADRFSRAALEGGTVTVRALAERVFVLAAMGKAGDAVALFKAYPNVGGPLAKWLRAYAVATNGKVDEARAIISAEDPPPALAPLPARTYAAIAYGAVKDTRHGNEYVKALVTAGFVNPDVAAAAEKVGAGKVARKR
ncbi:MAG: repeat protein [Labilithrix sp.]|nr:repeat protein [Labilithrix sp.]